VSEDDFFVIEITQNTKELAFNVYV